MYVSLLLCGILLVLIAAGLYRQLRRPRNYPPGPSWLPFIGNMMDIKKLAKQEQYQHRVFCRMAKEYNSPVLGLKLGNDLVVVVSSIETIRQVLTQEDYEARPDSYFIRLRCLGTRNGITFAEGQLWHEQRAFVVRHLRQLGYGKDVMESIIAEELLEMVKQLRCDKSLPGVRLGPYFSISVLNVLWTLTAGIRFSHSDDRLSKLLNLFRIRSKAFNISSGTLNRMPWLRFFAPDYIGYSLLMDVNKRLRTILTESIEEHRKTYCPNVTRDLIDAFLHEMEATKGKPSTFTEIQLIMICLDLFIAGSQITSDTLDFAFLCMVLYPDVQKHVQAEIRSAVGMDRPPNISDKQNMPYSEAVLLEVQRLCHVTPISGPRRALRDTTLWNYSIPKDTHILLNLYAIHTDAAHWGDAYVFRPDRFLNKQGALVTDNWFLPFGLGKRRCLGEVLARSCLFIFFTGILQRFHISPAPEQHLPTIEPQPGIIMTPQPYYTVLTPITN